jgi:hypothetical protein
LKVALDVEAQGRELAARHRVVYQPSVNLVVQIHMVDRVAVQKILEHSDIKITLKYAHVLDEQKRAAIDTIKL